MFCRGILFLLIALLAACGGLHERTGTQEKKGQYPGCMDLSAEQRLVVSVAEDLVAEGRLHAALANLETLPGELDEIRYNKARILRLLGSPRAKSLYDSILDGCFAAQGHHGLGQLAITEHNTGEAIYQLRKATRLSPVSASIRNDLGLAYLQSRRLQEAGFEFATSMELSPEWQTPVDNLLTLLVYADQWQQASELLERMRISPQQFQNAEKRARKLRRDDESAGRTPPTAGSLQKQMRE